jgi:hypothetical protein
MFSALHPYSSGRMMIMTAADTSSNGVRVAQQRVVRDGAVRIIGAVRCSIWRRSTAGRGLSSSFPMEQGLEPAAGRRARRADYPPACRASASSDVRVGLFERMDLSPISEQRAIVVSRG